jgi:hypothetical protein
MSIMYFYRYDQKVFGLNLLCRNKQQADVNETMQFGTLVSGFDVFCSTVAEDCILMGYDAAARGNQITFHGNIVFLSPRVDVMSQYVVHVDL